MKYLILLLLTTSCTLSVNSKPSITIENTAKPKYKQNQKVSFNLPDFYTESCIANGTIRTYEVDNNVISYNIYINPDSSGPCPVSMQILETDITGILK